jgi:acyl carrier protein
MTNKFLKLQSIVNKQLGVDLEKIKPNSDFAKELGADSLDVVELVMTIENEFNIEIEDQKASQIRTVQDAFNCINACLKE